jgi:hypothetical protein
MAKYDAALETLADAINAQEAALEEMRAAYVKLGGAFEDDAAEAEGGGEDAPKLIEGPKAEPPKPDAVPADGQVPVMIGTYKVFVSPRQAQVIQMLREATPGAPAKIDAIAQAYGGRKDLMYPDMTNLKKKLEYAGYDIVNVRGLGYHMQRAS